ncbi:hypothetical protein FRX31_026081 [Thalictrum thalictroides]|uniref:Uncharacterized protein n=1 Tax=Thalictrum thalictroides TaxID=46969 RepID=A0A7J6VHF5_THATH|nr:hypothetical protein FRX31_026081 [Thalictrum thalictroides]
MSCKTDFSAIKSILGRVESTMLFNFFVKSQTPILFNWIPNSTYPLFVLASSSRLLGEAERFINT